MNVGYVYWRGARGGVFGLGDLRMVEGCRGWFDVDMDVVLV
jgi:hypothetical protein